MFMIYPRIVERQQYKKKVNKDMKQNIILETSDICNIIALCESAGKILNYKENFQRIANSLRKQIGLQ